MSRLPKYLARFSNGDEIKLNTSTRDYTHAWLIIFPRSKDPSQNWTEKGFASSEALARRAMKRFMDRNPSFHQVVAVERLW
jgi:hypothetical protein